MYTLKAVCTVPCAILSARLRAARTRFQLHKAVPEVIERCNSAHAIMQLRAEYGGKHIYGLEVNFNLHYNSVGLDTLCVGVGSSKLNAINIIERRVGLRRSHASLGAVRCYFRLGQNVVRHLVQVYPGGAAFTVGHETAGALGLGPIESEGNTDSDHSSMPSLE